MVEQKTGTIEPYFFPYFFLTEKGENFAQFAQTVEKADNHIVRALRDYRSRMNTLLNEYGIPEDQRDQYLEAILGGQAAYFFGSSGGVRQRFESLEQAYQKKVTKNSTKTVTKIGNVF